MKKLNKKVLALILAVVIAISAMGISAMAIASENAESGVKVVKTGLSQDIEPEEEETADTDEGTDSEGDIGTYAISAAEPEEEAEIDENIESSENTRSGVIVAEAGENGHAVAYGASNEKAAEDVDAEESTENDVSFVTGSDVADASENEDVAVYVDGEEVENTGNVISAASASLEAEDGVSAPEGYDITSYTAAKGTDNKANTTQSDTLDVIFLLGQSNMEGQTATENFTTEVEQEILCDESMIYSTVIPLDLGGSNLATGNRFTEKATTGNVANYIASSLTSTTNKNGGTLQYQLNALSANGTGKTGPDSAIAYQWNKLTGRQVWVVNISCAGSPISRWDVKTGDLYPIATKAITNVLDVCQKEANAGNVKLGRTLMFWLQGEADCDTEYNYYYTEFNDMVSGLSSVSGCNAFGIISVRASQNNVYTGSADLTMTSPRLAQYNYANSHEDAFIVSDVNEQWVSDSGVKNYFASAYPNGISYNVRGNNPKKATTEADVHPNIHYTQLGHNENGITAATNMLSDLSSPPPITVDTFTVGLVNDNGTLTYKENGVKTSYTGFSQYGGDWWYVQNGTVDKSRNDILQGTVNSTNGWWYIVGGKVDFSYTGVSNFSNAYGWWYIKNGMVDFSCNSVEQNQYGWWYVKAGQVDFSYTGIASNSYGNWYIAGGQVDFGKNGSYTDSSGQVWTISAGSAVKVSSSSTSTGGTGFKQNGSSWYYYVNGNIQYINDIIEGTVNGVNGWWYVVNGRVDTSYTGVSNFCNAYGWWYIKNGMVDFSCNSVEQNQYGWWRVKAGQVDFSFTGVAQNRYGWWYCKGGEVIFSKNDIIECTVNGTSGWWYIVNGMVDTSYTGVSHFSNAYGWWYIKNGMVDFSFTGCAANQWAYWYCKNGQVDFSKTGTYIDSSGQTWSITKGEAVKVGYTGFKQDGSDWYYYKNDVKQTSMNDILEGTVNGVNGWWYIVNGKVDFSYTGVSHFCNAYGWWYIKNGMVDFSMTGVEANQYGYWRVVNGQVDFTCNSIELSANGNWYYIVGGEVQSNYTGVGNYCNAYGWWYIKNGIVDFSYTGLASNKYGTWYVKNGQVDFSFNGVCDGKMIANGQVV